MSEPVTIQTAAAVADPYSGATTDLDWSAPAEVEVQALGFDPGTGSEPVTDWRRGMSVNPTLYLPHDTTITAADRVVVRGLTYEVAGEPSDWRSPWTGQGVGLVVPLSKFGG